MVDGKQHMLQWKRLNDEVEIPEYAHHTDAGMDIKSFEDAVLAPGESKMIKTGLAMALPIQTEAQVRPRSGLAYKNQVTVLNTPGTIDEGYRGEVGIILINHGTEDFILEKGMRIAQIVVKPILKPIMVVVDELPEADRGASGFGSTGV